MYDTITFLFNYSSIIITVSSSSSSRCIVWIRFFDLLRFRIFEVFEHFSTFGRNPWTGFQPVARPLISKDSTIQNGEGTHPYLKRDSNPTFEFVLGEEVWSLWNFSRGGGRRLQILGTSGLEGIIRAAGCVTQVMCSENTVNITLRIVYALEHIPWQMQWIEGYRKCVSGFPGNGGYLNLGFKWKGWKWRFRWRSARLFH
jgi:hypothetical protein